MPAQLRRFSGNTGRDGRDPARAPRAATMCSVGSSHGGIAANTRRGATARFSRPATIAHRATSRSPQRPASPVRPFGASLLGLPSKSNSFNDSQTRYAVSNGAALILPQWHHQRIGAVVSAATDQEVFCFVFNPFGSTVDNYPRRGAPMPRDYPIFGIVCYRHRHGLFRFR